VFDSTRICRMMAFLTESEPEPRSADAIGISEAVEGVGGGSGLEEPKNMVIDVRLDRGRNFFVGI